MVLPLHDENPTRRRPVITILLIAMNAWIFLISPFTSHVVGRPSATVQCQVQAYLDEFAAKPSELVTNQAERVAATGALTGRPGLEGCAVSAPAYTKQPYLSVLTAMFVHAGWLHLLGNMLFLWVFGNNVEDRLGRLRFVGFYLLCGYVATYGFAVLHASSSAPLVGASGAIAGVLGAYLVLYPRAPILSLLTFLFFLPLRLPAWLVLGSWFGLQYIYFRGGGVAQGGIAYGAHLLGFLAGAMLIWPCRRRHRANRLARRRSYASPSA